MARAMGARAGLALAFESVYGTAPASGYFQIPFASTTLGTEQPLIDNELLGYGRDPLAPSRDAITSDGNVVIPLDVVAIGYWLKALFGAPTTTGTTPKTHTFASGGWTLPSLSIEKQLPDVPQFEMFSGVVADKLSLTMRRSGLLQATIDLIAQGSVTAIATAAGTPTAVTLQRFGHFNGAIKRNGSAIANIESAEINYMNNLDRIETIRSDGKIDGLDPSMAAMNGKLTARFADTTLFDQAVAGTSCSLEFSWTISASASLTIQVHEVYLPRPRVEIPGPGGIKADFDWQAAKAVSPGRMATAILVNTTASY